MSNDAGLPLRSVRLRFPMLPPQSALMRKIVRATARRFEQDAMAARLDPRTEHLADAVVGFTTPTRGRAAGFRYRCDGRAALDLENIMTNEVAGRSAGPATIRSDLDIEAACLDELETILAELSNALAPVSVEVPPPMSIDSELKERGPEKAPKDGDMLRESVTPVQTFVRQNTSRIQAAISHARGMKAALRL